MLIRLETRQISEHCAEHTGFLLIELNGKKYRRKLHDYLLHNEWRYKIRMSNRYYLMPWGLSSQAEHIDINKLTEVN